MRRGWRGAACLALVLATGAVLAADGVPGSEPTWWGFAGLPDQWRPGIPTSPELALPLPVTRDQQVQRVTLKETIALALENNPGIAAQRLEPTRQSTAILQAQAQFDPTLAGELLSNQSTVPQASALAGTQTLSVDDRTANFHLFKTFRSGATITMDSLNERLDNNSSFSRLRPQYKPQLNVSIVQPLLQSFGWDFSYLVVRVAQETADAALYTYRAQLTDFVEQVIEAYWAVVGARENVEVQRESKALADRTVEENQARVRVGLLAPVSVLEAQADAASREEQVIVAENTLAVARQQLAQLAFFRPEGTFVPRNLEPVDGVVPEEVTVDLDETLNTALAERPEIAASARGVQVQVLNERIAGNALLPRLDLVGSYGVNGLSGVSRPGAPVTTLVYSQTNLPRTAFPNAITACTPHPSGTGFLCRVSRTQQPVAFAGPVNQAYDRLTSDDFRSYSFGLRFQVPLSNAAARGQYTESRIARSEAELNHRALLSQVTLDVRQSVADLTSARQRIDTTRVARELAEENLRNQEKRHEVGMATTKDLLDFQSRLTAARAAEVQAKTDYATSVARWRRSEGRLLPYYQIVLDQPGRHSPPWFARF